MSLPKAFKIKTWAHIFHIYSSLSLDIRKIERGNETPGPQTPYL